MWLLAVTRTGGLCTLLLLLLEWGCSEAQAPLLEEAVDGPQLSHPSYADACALRVGGAQKAGQWVLPTFLPQNDFGESDVGSFVKDQIVSSPPSPKIG